MPELDDTATIRPPPAAFMTLNAGWSTRITPRRFTSITASKSSMVISSNGLSRRMAAFATTASSRPHSSIACSVRLAAPSGVATDSVFATASPPAALISWTTVSASPGSLPPPKGWPPRSFTTTRAPRLASSNA